MVSVSSPFHPLTLAHGASQLVLLGEWVALSSCSPLSKVPRMEEEYDRFDPQWAQEDLKRCQVLILAILSPETYRLYRELESESKKRCKLKQK